MRKSFKDSLKALETDIHFANTFKGFQFQVGIVYAKTSIFFYSLIALSASVISLGILLLIWAFLFFLVFADMEELCDRPDENAVRKIARAFQEFGQEDKQKLVLRRYMSKWKYIR